MDNSRFQRFHRANPEVYSAWCAIAREHRLDPHRDHLSASEVIESLRRKLFAFSNDFKPLYARKFNRDFDDGGALFRVAALRQS